MKIDFHDPIFWVIVVPFLGTMLGVVLIYQFEYIPEKESEAKFNLKYPVKCLLERNQTVIQINANDRMTLYKPERILQIALSLNNVKYEKHKLFQKGREFFHQVDIFIEPNLVLEVDGDYWHSLPEVIKRDNFNNKKLFELGNKVIRVKEHLIYEKVQEFVESIISCLK